MLGCKCPTKEIEGSEGSPNLPSSFLFKLCMDLAASDPNGLDTLTLTSHLHILAALGSVCRDLHDTRCPGCRAST